MVQPISTNLLNQLFGADPAMNIQGAGVTNSSENKGVKGFASFLGSELEAIDPALAKGLLEDSGISLEQLEAYLMQSGLLQPTASDVQETGKELPSDLAALQQLLTGADEGKREGEGKAEQDLLNSQEVTLTPPLLLEFIQQGILHAGKEGSDPRLQSLIDSLPPYLQKQLQQMTQQLEQFASQNNMKMEELVAKLSAVDGIEKASPEIQKWLQSINLETLNTRGFKKALSEFNQQAIRVSASAQDTTKPLFSEPLQSLSSQLKGDISKLGQFAEILMQNKPGTIIKPIAAGVPAENPSILLPTQSIEVASQTGNRIFTATTPIAQTVGQNGWDQTLGERMLWLNQNGIQNATIRLDPAALGPMEVRIQMQQEITQVMFSSQHQVVREALENAIPRLRELFNESGMQLADVDVSDQSLTQQHLQEERSQQFANQANTSFSEQEESEQVAAQNTSTKGDTDGLVDAYV